MGVRILLITLDNGKNARITVPDGGGVKFDFISVPNGDGKPTRWNDRPYFRALQIFDKADELIACFPDAAGFRDLAVNFTEEIVKEEGATIWKSDNNGYEREEKLRRTKEFDGEQVRRVTKK